MCEEVGASRKSCIGKRVPQPRTTSLLKKGLGSCISKRYCIVDHIRLWVESLSIDTKERQYIRRLP